MKIRATKGELAAVLKDALDAIPGWRVKARTILGLVVNRRCDVCLGWFDASRSPNARTCGRPACQRAYRENPRRFLSSGKWKDRVEGTNR